MGAPLAVNAGVIQGKLPLPIQVMHYWTAHGNPVVRVKDSHVFYTYVNRPPNARWYNMFYHILIFTDVFRTLLRPSTGCFTRIQTIYCLFSCILSAYICWFVT